MIGHSNSRPTLRFVGPLAMLLLACVIDPITPGHALQTTESFQVAFGTRQSGERRPGFADSGSMVVEADNGDLIIAGAGDSYYSDTGNRVYPMLVRINRNGRVLWTRIYNELIGGEILGLVERGGEHYILIKFSSHTDSERRKRGNDLLELWRADASGILERKLMDFDAMTVHSATTLDEGPNAVFLVAGAILGDHDPPFGDGSPVSLLSITLDGTIRTETFPENLLRVRELSYTPEAGYAFFTGQGYFRQADGVMTVSPDGKADATFTLDNDQFQPQKLVGSSLGIFVVGIDDHRNKETNPRSPLLHQGAETRFSAASRPSRQPPPY